MVVAYNNEFGEWLREIMRQRGIGSSRQVRIRTKVSHTTIDDILRGQRPTVETVIKIATGFHEDIRAALRLAGYDDVVEQLDVSAAEFKSDDQSEGETIDIVDLARRRSQIGSRIRARMDELDITQSDLGRAIGKSQGNISGYLDGRVGLDAIDLERIAKALHISVAELYGEDLGDDDADGGRPRLIAFYDDLTPDAKDDLLALAEAMWKRKRAQDPVHGRKAE